MKYIFSIALFALTILWGCDVSDSQPNETKVMGTWQVAVSQTIITEDGQSDTGFKIINPLPTKILQLTEDSIFFYIYNSSVTNNYFVEKCEYTLSEDTIKEAPFYESTSQIFKYSLLDFSGEDPYLAISESDLEGSSIATVTEVYTLGKYSGAIPPDHWEN